MPSTRKRIGYLPSLNIQEIINKIAKEEKLSQSKVVGILVEEALKARGAFDFQTTNNLIRERSYRNKNNIKNSSFNYSELDELISDNGITYNKEKHKNKSNTFSPEAREAYNEDLFEQFKQFIIFRKMIEEK